MDGEASVNQAGRIGGFIVRAPGGRAGPAELSGRGADNRLHSTNLVEPGARPQPNQAGWDVLFDAVLERPKGLRQSRIRSDRLEALDRVYQISNV